MVKYRQCNMSGGELDPLLLARNDIEIYDKGLEKARNVFCLPEGGVGRRPGLKYLDKIPNQLTYYAGVINATAPNGGTAANSNDHDDATVVLTTTNINATNPYVVIQYDLGAPTFISFIDVRQARLTGGVLTDTFNIQVSADNANWVNVGANIPVSTTKRCHRRRLMQSFQYVRFAKTTNTNLGAIFAEISDFNILVENANVASSPALIAYRIDANSRYVLSFTNGVDDGNIAIYRNRALVADVSTRTMENTFGIGKEQGPTDWASYGKSLLFMSLLIPSVKPSIITRLDITGYNADTVWQFQEAPFETIPTYNFDPSNSNPNVTLTPSAVDGQVTLTASGATFLPGDVGNWVDGGGGRAKITAYTSNTVVTAVTVIPFYTTGAIPALTWVLERGYEPTWGTVRGWPTTGTFFQDRLWLASSFQRLTTIWASVRNDFFNFEIGNVRDTDAIETTNNNFAEIIKLYSHRSMVAFTLQEELSMLLQRGQAATPSSAFFIPQTDIGILPGLRPVVSNGSLIFVRRGGPSLAQLVFSELEQAFTSENISIFSSHLIGNGATGDFPVLDFDVRKSTNSQETDWLLIVNSDGTMTVGSLMTEQNIKGFCLWQFTNGSVVRTAVDTDDVYVHIVRNIQGLNVSYLEVFDPSCYTDSCVQQNLAGGDTITGLNHLEGQQLRVIGDGLVFATQAVAGGQITIESDVQGVAEAGLNFNVQVKTLPIEMIGIVGEQLGKKRRISSATLVLNRTSQVLVNGVELSLRDPGPIVLDDPLPIFSGRKRVQGLRGWDEYGQIEITQNNPLPFTLLAIGLEVDY